MFKIQSHTDVVQYEAEIVLPDNFYSDRQRRQSSNEDVEGQIKRLIAEVSQSTVTKKF